MRQWPTAVHTKLKILVQPVSTNVSRSAPPGFPPREPMSSHSFSPVSQIEKASAVSISSEPAHALYSDYFLDSRQHAEELNDISTTLSSNLCKHNPLQPTVHTQSTSTDFQSKWPQSILENVTSKIFKGTTFIFGQ